MAILSPVSLMGPFTATCRSNDGTSWVTLHEPRKPAFTGPVSLHLDGKGHAPHAALADGINAALVAHEKEPLAPFEFTVDLHEDVAPDLFEAGAILRVGWEWGFESEVSVVFVRAYGADGVPIVLTAGIKSRLMANDFVQRAIEDARVDAAVAEREAAAVHAAAADDVADARSREARLNAAE